MRHSSSFAVFAALAAAVPAVVVAAPAAAQVAPAVQPYNQAAFDAAQRAGKPILVWVHAPWCPVCRAQARAIASSETPRTASRPMNT